MTISSAPRQIVPLTSARFFAALYVMLYHGLAANASASSHRNLFERFIGLGYVSVSFFFMLSGFILAVVYLKEDRPVNKRRFFVSRFARIYPLYLAAMMLDLPHFIHIQRYVLHTSPGHMIATIVKTAVLIQAWFTDLGGLNFPSWSLSAEAFFYLLFPFVGPVLWRQRGRTMLWLSVLFYVGGIWVVKMLDERQHHLYKQTYNPVPYLFVFLLGICVAKLFVWINRRPARWMVLQRSAPWLLLGGIFLFFMIPLFDLQVPEIQMQHALLVPLFALAILAFASENRLIMLLFSSNLLVVLGEASFALYLIHTSIAVLMRRWLEHYGTPMFLLYVFVTIALSVASLKWLETPARRWILKREGVRSRETEVSSALSQ
jgi:peptidoglycan/LPS O-acetylase OafA/YrhL